VISDVSLAIRACVSQQHATAIWYRRTDPHQSLSTIFAYNWMRNR
jgi:hypothetical protein